MPARNGIVIAALVLASFAFGSTSNAVAADSVANADDLVARSLDSIAPAKTRADLKTRVAQGPVRYTILVGGSGIVDGKAFLISQGPKLQFMMKLPNNEYHGEQFVFDGDKDKVAFSTANQNRSSLGNFVFVQDAVIREGLIGGVLSTAWPLYDLNSRKAKLTLEGIKKIDGQDLYEVRYRPHKSSDLDIKLYFDPATYRHVETVYSYTSSQSFANLAPSTAVGVGPTAGGNNLDAPPTSSTQSAGGTAETAGARQLPNRYRLQEKFSDFKTVDGVTLPTHYNVQFTQELQNGRTTLNEWDMKGLDVGNNISLDARNFDVK